MFCKHCDNKLPSEAKFCNKCGLAVNTIDTSYKNEVDIEKLKKSIKNTGESAYAIGWLTVIMNLGIYIWSVLDTNFSNSGLPLLSFPDVFSMIVFGSIFIILGNRIRHLVDKKIKLYLQVLLGTSILFSALILVSGGQIGLLFLILIVYLVSSVVSINKLMKIKEFVVTLSHQEYKITKDIWLVLVVISFFIFFLSGGFNVTTSKEQIIKAMIAKEDMTFPTEINEVVTLTGIFEEVDAIRYELILHDIDKGEVNNELIENYKKEELSSWCADKDIRNVIDKDISIKYVYRVKDSPKVLLSSISKEDCL